MREAEPVLVVDLFPLERFELLMGNMSLWLKSCGRYDRKSTESSNLAFLPLLIPLYISFPRL